MSSRDGKKKRNKKPKPHPQYCFDGKARKGCRSKVTGREEIDVTIYCPETWQVLDKRTLDDKEGERLAVIEILKTVGHQLPTGIISADAGIVSPAVTQTIVDARHGYVLQIKGNCGIAYEQAGDLPWNRVVVADEEMEKGHGRDELRIVKAIEAEFADLGELDKYANISVILQVERTSRYGTTGKVTSETSYYSGDEVFASLDIGMQARYIRDHWSQESYHWIKDKVMQEDNSMQRTSNGSRALSTIRSVVAKLGRIVCDSPKTFIDRFTSDPHNVALSL